MDKLDREDGKLDNISLFYSLIRDIAECIQKMAFYIFEAPGGYSSLRQIDHWFYLA